MNVYPSHNKIRIELTEEDTAPIMRKAQVPGDYNITEAFYDGSSIWVITEKETESGESPAQAGIPLQRARMPLDALDPLL